MNLINVLILQIRISASSIYGDILWMTEFNVGTSDYTLQSWATGSAITNSTSVPLGSQAVTFRFVFIFVVLQFIM